MKRVGCRKWLEVKAGGPWDRFSKLLCMRLRPGDLTLLAGEHPKQPFAQYGGAARFVLWPEGFCQRLKNRMSGKRQED